MGEAHAGHVPSLAELADRLSEVLAAETALLESLDLREAGALLPRKRDAAAGLQEAMTRELPELGGERPHDGLRVSLHFLCTQLDMNRVALERALAAQMQLMAAIARAVPKAMAASAPLYRPDGCRKPPRPPGAYAFLARM